MARQVKIPNASSAETLPWIAVGVVALGALILMQQWGVWLSSSTMSSTGQQHAWSTRLVEPGLDELTVVSKAMVRLYSIEDSFDDNEFVYIELDERVEVVEGIASFAMTAAEEIRVAVVAGKLVGPEEAMRRLDDIDARLDVRAEIRGDVRWFRELYEAIEHAVEDGTVPTITGREAMRARHGWFADLALAQLHPDQADEAITGGGLRLLAVFAGVGIAQLLVSIMAVVVGIWALVQFVNRDSDAIEISQDVEPAYLQATVLFLIGAILFSGLGAAATSSQGNASVGFFVASEVAVWIAALAVLWPRLRGVPGMVFRADTGWTLGDGGVLREVGWGFAGFCVSTAVTIVLGIVMGMIFAIVNTGSGAGGVETVDLPLFDSPIAPTWGLVLLGAVTAVFWAPIFEELIFRGCLFAWLRHKLGMWGTVVVTAIAFGAIHPYSIDGMVMVASGGVVYALLREWRGSLIAPITAHMLHNGFLMFTELAVLAAID